MKMMTRRWLFYYMVHAPTSDCVTLLSRNYWPTFLSFMGNLTASVTHILTILIRNQALL
eukprot:Gb_25637 [translate_table: standard]